MEVFAWTNSLFLAPGYVVITEVIQRVVDDPDNVSR